MKKMLCMIVSLLLLCALMIFPALGEEIRLERMDTFFLKENERHLYLGEGWILNFNPFIGNKDGAYFQNYLTGEEKPIWGEKEFLMQFYIPIEQQRMLSAERLDAIKEQLPENIPLLMQGNYARKSWRGERYLLLQTDMAPLLIDWETGECLPPLQQNVIGMLPDDTVIFWQPGDEQYSLYQVTTGKEWDVALALPEGFTVTHLLVTEDQRAGIVYRQPEKLTGDAVMEYAVCFFDEGGGLIRQVPIGHYRFLTGPDALIACAGCVLAYSRNIAVNQHYFCSPGQDEARALVAAGAGFSLIPLSRMPRNPESQMMEKMENVILPVGASRDGKQVMILDWRGEAYLYDLMDGASRQIMNVPEMSEMQTSPIDIANCIWDGENILGSSVKDWFQLVNRESFFGQ